MVKRNHQTNKCKKFLTPQIFFNFRLQKCALSVKAICLVELFLKQFLSKNARLKEKKIYVVPFNV